MASPILAGKLEAEIKIKSDPDEFFHSFGGKAHKLPNLCSDKVHGVNVHEGDWKTKGSVKLWTYAIDGKVETLKERLTVDEENKTVSAEAIGGHILEQLKTYKAALQVIAKGGSNYAKWTIEYENINENEPAPTKYLHWLIHAGKDVDASLVKMENRDMQKRQLKNQDKEKKVKSKVIEGDLMELYKTFTATFHVDTYGDGNLVASTFEYEKLNEKIPDPNTLMEYCINVTKHIETYHLK